LSYVETNKEHASMLPAVEAYRDAYGTKVEWKRLKRNDDCHLILPRATVWCLDMSLVHIYDMHICEVLMSKMWCTIFPKYTWKGIHFFYQAAKLCWNIARTKICSKNKKLRIK
jgi:hypothetical protein